ncbi:L-aspartate oxidase [Sulfuriroseicoccus oceanibius]|uniref:L-aspartate oxidase n=1 Tax=Sulfuriroseicoccus oceanibius TaxID=2707525 RepID=A0A6B3LDA4_9BACT|nr:L-aspartate oxidase [Sulfuriroseicoccus oceanibius]QQL45207.1 L-aspartate oxidase [Sulfuriroseicoccus oceanibius]
MDYDFVIVGSGIAGLSAALKAADHGRVLVLTKRMPELSNTAWAQGGIACVMGDDDSFDEHVADTLNAGAGLCDEAVVRTMVEEGPARINELIEWGVEFDKSGEFSGAAEAEESHSSYDLGREGGHTKRRVLHHRDSTGKEMIEKLLAAVNADERIDVLPNHFAIDLITTGKLGFVTRDEVVGLYVLDEDSGEVKTMRCQNVILCTGGCGKVYLYTTNPDTATGDGVAMAWRAGATIANMEFMQFHPTCLYHHEVKSFLISEAVRGEGAVLVGQDGKEFMHKYDERGSLAPRDIVARAIDSEIKRTGGPCVYLDCTAKSREFWAERFPLIFETCQSIGIDMSKQPVPVVPAAHYSCGGVETDINGRSSLPGLYAVGEVANTGLHGANRLASNSLLEGVVVSHRAIDDIVKSRAEGVARTEVEIPEWESGDAVELDELVVIYHNWDEIRRCMGDYVSIVRTGKRLKRAATRLRNLAAEVQEYYWGHTVTTDLLELRNLVTTAALIVDSAQQRKESRGLHYTLDYPERDENECHPTRLRRS